MKLKCSFQNVQQNWKILTRLTKKNKVKTQITKIRNKNRDITHKFIVIERL